MFKSLVSITSILILLGFAFFGWKTYSNYKERQAERQARLQQKAEEVTVTTIEGWTVKEIAAELEKKGLVKADEFIKTANAFDSTNYPLTSRPTKSDLEGYLFPDTYRFAKDSTAESILSKMLDDFTDRMASVDVTAYSDNIAIPGYGQLNVQGGDGKPGMSLYDIITLASIIEKESGGKGAESDPNLTLNDERKLVASVFYNRLKIGQALESDATINYVTGKNDPGASLKDLEINSPYNTYKFPGLPPGPICNPSLGSIKAALNPAVSDYLYFLHKQPSGRVEFSKTFDEHVRSKTQ